MGFLDKLAGVFTGPLTRPGLMDPTTGQMTYYGSPEEVQSARAAVIQSNSDLADEANRRMLASAPSPLAPPDGGNADGSMFAALNTPPTPQSDNMAAPVPADQPAQGGNLFNYLGTNVRPGKIPDPAPVPVPVKAPTFQQASTNPMTGMPAPLNPAETKLGKFLSILHGAVQGGMAGEAASAQAVAASGGHRGGNFASGFQAAKIEPYMDAERRQQVQQGALQNQMAQTQMQQMQIPVQYKGQSMPYWMAQRQMALDKEQATTAKDRFTPTRDGRMWDNLTQSYAPGSSSSEHNSTMPNLYAAAWQDAVDRGVDPNTDPKVQQALAAMQAAAPAKDKPDTGVEVKQHFQGIVAKLVQEGLKFDPNSGTSVQKAIRASKSLSPDERSSAIGYLATNPTPGATNTNINVRMSEMAGAMQNRTLYPITDKQTGVTSPMTVGQYLAASSGNPGRYISPQYDIDTQTGIATAKAGAVDFAKGKGADQVQSFGTFIGHANDLSNSVNEIRNTKSPLINKPLNWLQNNAFGNANVTAVLAKVEPARTEFESFLNNNNALHQDQIAEGHKIIDENKSPAQMQAAIKSWMNTAAIRMNELNRRYKNSHNGQDDPNLMTPENYQILQQFGAANDLQWNPQRAQGASRAQVPDTAYRGKGKASSGTKTGSGQVGGMVQGNGWSGFSLGRPQ